MKNESFIRANWRITLLTERLVRLEYDPRRRFTDACSLIVVNRDFPDVAAEITEQDGVVAIKTAAAEVWLNTAKDPMDNFCPAEVEADGGGLNRGLKCSLNRWAKVIAVRLAGKQNIWTWGESLHNLGGTVRTLDKADGAVRMDDGLFSLEGIGILRDDSCLRPDAQSFWPRPSGTEDMYLFLYGKDFVGGLRDFYRLSGATPLLPAFALGNWWSRYWRYSQAEYLALIERFKRENLPFSVAVIDMDWHLTDVPDGGNGWTGFSWNRELFPDPAGFLRRLHAAGLKTALNLHPAAGVQPFEDEYQAFKVAMAGSAIPTAVAGGKDGGTSTTGTGTASGTETASGTGTIPFDFTDPKFRRAYFDTLLAPLEADGTDFWWIDWQQGENSKIPGLDPLWLLNCYHFVHAATQSLPRLILSRYAGPGSHRYPIGFSGDTVVSWASLAFQPYFTATAANIGYGWWSHDIGGHMNGIRDDELACRWLQFGVFSPINRLHSTCNRFAGKEPWNYSIEVRTIMGNFLRLRAKLLPYLHSMNYRSHLDGIPIVRPLYHAWPEEEAAYHCPNEYQFGSEMLVEPVTTKMNALLRLAETEAWLPEGMFFDFFTGVRYRGGRRVKLHRPLAEIPVLVPAGGIVPLEGDSLTIRLYPGADGEFTLYEDDECGADGDSANPRKTRIQLKWDERSVEVDFRLGRVKSFEKGLELHFMRTRIETITLTSKNGNMMQLEPHYEPATQTTRVLLPAVKDANCLHINFTVSPNLPGTVAEQREFIAPLLEEILNYAQIDFDFKERIFHRLQANGFTVCPDLAEVADEVQVGVSKAAREISGLLTDVINELL